VVAVSLKKFVSKSPSWYLDFAMIADYVTAPARTTTQRLFR
jgi:hypothetical protein